MEMQTLVFPAGTVILNQGARVPMITGIFRTVGNNAMMKISGTMQPANVVPY